MHPRSLRQFANSYGAVGLLLVGAYLLAWHLWTKKRRALLAGGIVFLLTGACVVACFYPRSVSQDGHRLSLGPIRTEASLAPHPLEQRILEYWDTDSQTEQVRGLVREFAWAVVWQDRVRAGDLSRQLCRLFRPPTYSMEDKDGQWLLHAVIGQIYLERAWQTEAESEFQSVLVGVPHEDSAWGQSIARQMATYGLAHTHALRGSYQEALAWLERAPDEYKTRCGNGIEAEAVANHPLQVVWAIASEPLPTAEKKLRAIMGGRFTPVESTLHGDTSKSQKHHAAAEAGLTLGCLYAQAGRRADAEACWHMVASNPTSNHEAADIARSLLGRLR